LITSVEKVRRQIQVAEFPAQCARGQKYLAQCGRIDVVL